MEGTDDNLYGVTPCGGPTDNGVIFRLTMPSLVPTPAFGTPTLLLNGMIVIAWNTVTGQTYQVQYVSDLRSTNWVNLGVRPRHQCRDDNLGCHRSLLSTILPCGVIPALMAVH